MLILTQRIGETLKIGDEVSVTVLDVKGNQVRRGATGDSRHANRNQESGAAATPDLTPG